MALDFRRVEIDFDATTGAVDSETRTVAFDRRINRADAAISGFVVRYTNGDHPTLRQAVDVSTVSIDNQDHTVTVRAGLLIRDNTGDDPFRGTIDVLVIADLVD